MEKIGTRKFMAMTTMETVLIMLVLGVAHADSSPRLHHLLSLPPPPRRLLSLPARNDFRLGSMISGLSKIPGIGKVINKI